MNRPVKIAFLDRDGTLIHEPPDEQVDRLDKVRLVEGVVPALLRLRDAGYEFVMVSNQDGRGTTSFPERDFQVVQEFVLEVFRSQGIGFRDIFICPHLPGDGCACRKPRTGLLTDFLRATSLDRSASVVIGDRDSDMELAANIGLRSLRLDPAAPGDWDRIVHLLVDLPRTATVVRTTRETRISCCVDLDADGPIRIATGIGFFDHMLVLFAKHGLFDLDLEAKGDLEVDAHHTVEDVGLALGQALREAIGDKKGMIRYGWCLLPMDDALARIALDCSGRPYLAYDAPEEAAPIENFPFQLVEEFLRAFCVQGGLNLHVALLDGRDSHHMAEAVFKGLARALDQATRIDPRVQGVPSTKGSL